MPVKTKIKIEKIGPKRFMRVSLDGKRIIFKGGGDTATVELAPGLYVITWHVVAAVGTEYYVKVSSITPKKVLYEFKDKKKKKVTSKWGGKAVGNSVFEVSA